MLKRYIEIIKQCTYFQICPLVPGQFQNKDAGFEKLVSLLCVHSTRAQCGTSIPFDQLEGNKQKVRMKSNRIKFINFSPIVILKYSLACKECISKCSIVLQIWNGCFPFERYHIRHNFSS